MYVVGDTLPARATFYVYTLNRGDHSVFYVGMTDNPRQRIAQHRTSRNPLVAAALAQPGAYMRIVSAHEDREGAAFVETAMIGALPGLFNIRGVEP